MYLVVIIWGFITGDQLLWLTPVDAADNILHLLIAAGDLAARFSSRDMTEPGTTARLA